MFQRSKTASLFFIEIFGFVNKAKQKIVVGEQFWNDLWKHIFGPGRTL
jgi:hypothetical protein